MKDVRLGQPLLEMRKSGLVCLSGKIPMYSNICLLQNFLDVHTERNIKLF